MMQALINGEISDEDHYLYAEDLIPLQRARDKLLREIDEMEKNQADELQASLNILNNP